MRISPQQIATIIHTARSVVGQDTQVWLFGSRLDDSRKGGDIDLLVESAPMAGLIERPVSSIVWNRNYSCLWMCWQHASERKPAHSA